MSGKIEPQVIRIPATKIPSKHRRVAIYTRVSTLHEAQTNSIMAQNEGLKQLVDQNKDWELTKIYADHGASGTNIKSREAFNQMLDAAKAHEFDLIITKSVSRFARNVVDAITATRELKRMGVEVFFQSQDLSSYDNDSELIFSLLATYAQEESRNLSENIKWGMKRKIEKGKYTLPYKIFLGYKKGSDGQPEIVEEEAEIVRKIYKYFLRGLSINGIADILTKAEIPSPMKRTSWCYETVRNILTNEKYKGDYLMGKTFVEDFITHKTVKNIDENGDLIRPQYYVSNGHPAIISPEIFDEVQKELERRKQLGVRLTFYG